MAVIKQNISYGENKPQRAFYGQGPLTAMYYKPDAETDPQLVYFYSEGTPGLTYTKGNSENFLTIGDNKGFDFSGQGGALVTPAITYEYGDTNTIYKVTKMADHAFQGNTTLTSAVVDGNVTNIGDNAFNSCSNLRTITVGNSVETIANGGINNCENLESIILGDNVQEIGTWAFAFNPKLKTIEIPSSVISLGRNVFEACFGLVSIRCSAKLSEVPIGMCHSGSTDTGTMSLESVRFGGIIKKIGEAAFYNCVKLNNIDNYTSEVSLVDLSDVQEIAGNAFYNCKGITNLHIGKKFKSAESTSFKGCTGIKTLTIPCALTARGTDDVPTLAHISKDTLSKLTITGGEDYATDAGDYTYTEVKNGFGGSIDPLFSGGSMTELVIDFEGYSNNKYSIANEAFLGCPNLKKVTLKKVRLMGKRAFRDCGSLETASIYMGNYGVVGEDTFAYSALKELKLYGANSIGDRVFRNSVNLTTVYIPKTIVSIGNGAFAGCSSLKDIYYSGTSSEWNSMTKGTDWDKETGQYTLHTDWKYN